MRFSDIGYTTLREDIVQESSWNDYSNYYKSIGREDKLVGENLLAWPEKNEYEFGDNIIIGTVQQSDFRVTRIVYLGDFTYSETGQLTGKNLSGQYYWTYGHEDSTYGTGAPRTNDGVVKSFSPRFYFDMLNYAESEKEFEEYQNSDQIIHVFDDEDENKHGLGKAAFADPAVSRYFQEDWYLNPFGNNFNGTSASSEDSDSDDSSSSGSSDSSSDSSSTSVYLRPDWVVASTWSDTVRINLEKTGSSSDSVIQAKQVDKSEYDSGFVGSIITGTSGDDIIRGLAGFDQLFGKAGDDLIHGGNGRDIIDGGSGSDELHGDFGWNTFLDQQDGSKDLIAIKSDQHLSNFWYGKAGNSPNGEKADFIEGLDATDEIKIIGVFTPDISVVDNVTARGVTGIGIYAKGTLEAVYTGGNLSTSQIQNMTTGDGSTTAMNNQMWSYWGDNTVPPLQA